MSPSHVSEIRIQQFAMDRTGCDEETLSHLRTCAQCREKAEAYRLIFLEIPQLPRPALATDLKEHLLQELTRNGELPQKGWGPVAGWMGLGLGLGATALTGYLYRSGLSAIYKKYILHLFTNLSRSMIYLWAATALVLLIFQGLELWEKHRKKMDHLNFY